jgi:hypothetical protein
VEGWRSGFSKLGEAEGEERDLVLSLAGHRAGGLQSWFAILPRRNIDRLEAARTLAEELKSVSGKLASWQPGNLGEEFILGRSDWGCFELKEGRREFVLDMR